MDKEICFEGYTARSWFAVEEEICKKLHERYMNDNVNQKYKGQKLQYIYVNNEKVNGYTFSDEVTDNIVINTGTVGKIWAYMYSIFSGSEYFREVGDAKLEKSRIVCMHLDVENKCVYFDGQPKCDARRQIAEAAANFAHGFVLNHELGHLLNGHSYLLNDWFGFQKIFMNGKGYDENIPKGELKKQALVRRTLEMDADAFAITQGMNNVISIYVGAKEARHYVDLLDKPIHIFCIYGFAIHALFCLLERETVGPYNDEASYMPVKLRFGFFVTNVMDIINKYLKDIKPDCTENEKEEIIKEVLRGCKEGEEYYKDRYQEETGFMEAIVQGDKLIKSMDEINEYWNCHLVEQLRPYARAGLYEPDKRHEKLFIKYDDKVEM